MITLENVTKVFETKGKRVVAVNNVSMSIKKGELCVLLGPSGSGKTTLMKVINRLCSITSGKILVESQDVREMDAIQLRRQMGYVIQQVGLFPNKTVKDNIATVPKLLHWPRSKIDERIDQLLAMMNLDPATFKDRYPRELSGGQQQRIGVARALAADPPIMLMDEPFGAVDPITRRVIQDEFLNLQEQMKKTIIFVSHDIDEAIKMGDRIALLNEGMLIQYGSPEEILALPKNEFVGDFVGKDRTIKQLGLLTVQEAMETNPILVITSRSLSEAKRIMRENHLEYVPVVDEHKVLKGYLGLVEIEQQQGRIEDALNPADVIAGDSSIREALSRMMQRVVDFLCVCDHQGHLEGILRFKDIRALLRKRYGAMK